MVEWGGLDPGERKNAVQQTCQPRESQGLELSACAQSLSSNLEDKNRGRMLQVPFSRRGSYGNL